MSSTISASTKRCYHHSTKVQRSTRAAGAYNDMACTYTSQAKPGSVLARLCLGGGAAPPYCANIPTPLSVSQRLLHPPLESCNTDLYSIIITIQLYTCKYMAIDCAIVTLAEDRGWI